MKPTRVFLVDDTATVRHILVHLLETEPDMEVSGTAGDGEQALRRLKNLDVDVVVLDVEMPGMGGLEMLRELRRVRPRLPVILFSSLTERGAMVTIEGLSLGASDYVTKPCMTGSAEEARAYIRSALIGKIRALAGSRVETVAPAPVRKAHGQRRDGSRVDAVVIGISMGGPNALGMLLPRLPEDFPVPVFVVQHMPALFISALAQRLADRGRLPVRECLRAESVSPGQIWLAAGGYHMEVSRDKSGVRVFPTLGEPVNFCRPAADVLFASAVSVYGSNLLAVVMTGMGQDGLEGARGVVDVGGQVVVQDRDSSVVWGMAGSVVNAGLADAEVPLEEMAAEICRRVAAQRAWHAPAHEGRSGITAVSGNGNL